MYSLRNPFLCLLLIFAFASCKKESNAPSWDVDVIAPIIKSTISLNNIVTDSLILSNPDSSIKLVYNSELFSFSADTLVEVPDTIVKSAFVSPFTFPINYQAGPTAPLINKNSEIDFNALSVQLREIDLKSEDITFDVKNKIKAVIVFSYKIPCATLGGVPFELFDSVPAADVNGPGIYNKTISLAGYHVDLRGFNQTGSNIVSTSIIAYISTVSGTTSVAPEDSLIILNGAHNIKPSYAIGYLGQTTVTIGPTESTFNLFKGIKSGLLTLDDAKLNLTIENNFGIDARVKFTNISSTNTTSGTTVALSGYPINTSININRAVETGISSNPVTPAVKTISLSKTNSTIQTLIGNMPDKLDYTFELNVNPLGNVSNSNDFMFIDYGLKTKLNLEVPLNIRAQDILLIDTVKADLSSATGASNVNSGNFSLVVNNTFPFEASVQLYLLDGSLAKVDSLLVTPNNIIFGADVDLSGKVTQAKTTNLIIPVSKNKIERLLNTKQILIVAKLNTSNQPQTVKFYDYYKLDFKLIADVNYHLDFK